MKPKLSIVNILKNLDLILAGIALLVLIAITFGGVIMRRMFNNPFIWLEEVQIGCFIWITFFGAGAVCRNGGHVAIDILVDMFPRWLQKIVQVFIYAVTILIVGYVGLKGIVLVQQLMNSGKTTPILDIPYPFFYGAMPIGCGLMIVNYIAVEVMTWRSDRKQGRKEESPCN